MGISLCVPCFNVWESKNLSELERAIGLRVGSERVFLVSAGLFVVFFMFQGDRGGKQGGFLGHRGSREGDRPKWPAATSRNCSSILPKTQKVGVLENHQNALYVHQKSALQLFEFSAARGQFRLNSVQSIAVVE